VLAIAAQAPVVPTVVHGSREVMPKGSFRIRSGTIDLHFLEPAPTIGLTYDHRRELMAGVWRRMADEMESVYAIGTAEHPIAAERVSGE
jgi:1-acyl-sn-glycerol-3-phosphate acyltransferase